MKKIKCGKMVDLFHEIRTKEGFNWCDAGKLREKKDELKKQTAEIDAALKAVQYRSRERTIDSADILREMSKINESFDIPKKALKGTNGIVNLYMDKFPKAYRYRAVGTAFTFEHDGAGWVITDIYRTDCNGSPKNRYLIRLSDEAKERMLDKMAHLEF